MADELVTCKHPCSRAAGHELCRHCARWEQQWGEAMAALIDDGDEPELVRAPSELGHIRAEEA